jgi:hypothetical protein
MFAATVSIRAQDKAAAPAGAPPEKPTLRARYIGPAVAQVRIKLPGYAEIVVPIEFEAGKKIDKTESLFAG